MAAPSQISPSTIPLPGETISQMPAAMLPLSLQELIPLVQNGANVKTPLRNVISSGGGGITSAVQIEAGATGATAAFNSINLWNSATASNKTQPIPTAIGSFAVIFIMDQYGLNAPAGGAYPYPITAVPLSGSVIGLNQVYTNGGSIMLIDTPFGWVSL
jgi:hypothetical protein